MRRPNQEKIEQVMHNKGFAYFVNGDHNVNVIGIRTKNRIANVFDDLMTISYKENGVWQLKVWPCTTDPGTYWLKNPLMVKGTAILVPNQYRSVYSIDYHNGKYLALCQRKGDVAVYRDKNRNNILDFEPESIMWGRFGINIHKAGESSYLVDRWSAGCQVFKRRRDFDEFMRICTISKNKYGNSFTYTLLTEKDF